EKPRRNRTSRDIKGSSPRERGRSPRSNHDTGGDRWSPGFSRCLLFLLERMAPAEAGTPTVAARSGEDLPRFEDRVKSKRTLRFDVRHGPCQESCLNVHLGHLQAHHPQRSEVGKMKNGFIRPWSARSLGGICSIRGRRLSMMNAVPMNAAPR